ncbi:alpha-hydroxy-acid oxidizing protein [Variovorax fucosicus]|nr:alpha-hydroxy-acid oxidizing protein [Variovorax sp. J22G47]MDM0058487.1 alpha-hydroxy-acid oxidizing protein [Variovorax sp. J22G47]
MVRDDGEAYAARLAEAGVSATCVRYAGMLHTFFGMRDLAPRVLVDVSNVDLTTRIVGAPAAASMLIAPTGAIGAGWPQADLAIARAAAKAGLA